MRTKGLFILCSFFIFFSLSACGSGSKEDSAGTIGIAMPSKALERWEKDGDFMIERLQEKRVQDRYPVRTRRCTDTNFSNRKYDHKGCRCDCYCFH